MKISSLLLILITFSMGAALFMSVGTVFGNIHDMSPTAPVKIEIISFSGGDRYNDSVRFQDNILILKHVGGRSVQLENISVQISGAGNAYQGIPGSNGILVYGDISVFYENIGSRLKNKDFEKNNKETIQDGVWSAGEFLILTGNDSLNTTASSVSVSVNGNSNTSNNYGLSSNKTIEIQIFQKNKAGNLQSVLKKEIKVLKYKPPAN